MGKLKKALYYLACLTILAVITCFKNKNDIDIDSIFVAWNKATIKDLSIQAQKNKSNKVRAKLYNELKAFRNYIDIKNDSEINRTSIRYIFLNTIKEQMNAKELFAVEAIYSGEEITIRSILIIPEIAEIKFEYYTYGNKNWVKDSSHSVKRLPQYLEINSLADFITNKNSITITQFKNAKVYKSSFYRTDFFDSSKARKIASKVFVQKACP